MRYAIIAGNGRFPRLALENAQRLGHDVTVVLPRYRGVAAGELGETFLGDVHARQRIVLIRVEVRRNEQHIGRELRDELTSNGFEVGVHDLHHDGKLYRNRASFADKATRINRYLEEWEAAGFREYFRDDSICLIEWPEHAGGFLPPYFTRANERP